jgi:hypothetical protein
MGDSSHRIRYRNVSLDSLQIQSVEVCGFGNAAVGVTFSFIASASCTMPILQDQDGWWGEGDELFSVDDSRCPRTPRVGPVPRITSQAHGALALRSVINFTESPSWVRGKPDKNPASYRFHLDRPIPFTKHLKATIEHGSF